MSGLDTRVAVVRRRIDDCQAQVCRQLGLTKKSGCLVDDDCSVNALVAQPLERFGRATLSDARDRDGIAPP